MPRCPLSHGKATAVCTLLPLSLVPAGERCVLRVKCHDRGRSSGSSGRGAGDHRHTLQQRTGAEDRALPQMPGGPMEQLCECGPRRQVCSGRHTRLARSLTARYTHFYLLEAAMGATSSGHSIGPGILRSRLFLASRESRPPSFGIAQDRGLSGVAPRRLMLTSTVAGAPR